MIWRIGEPAQRYVRVLLVDDDEEDALIARELLSEAEHVRFAVTWARDAGQALALLAHEPFDACLLDLRLGAESGLDVLAEARKSGARLPIVVLTGASDHDVDMRAMEAGADDYLVKGKLDATLLERTLRYAIAHAQAQAKLEERAAELELTNRALEDTRRLLEQSNARLATMVRRQNELLGMAAHDLRSPLGIVRSYLDLLAEGGQPPPEQQRILDRIRGSVTFMVAIIDDLLDLSSISSGTLALDRQSRDLSSVVRRSADDLRALAQSKGITLRVSTPEVPIEVAIDERRFEQVVQNLVGNAIKYSHPGSDVRIRVDGSEDRAAVIVEDDGVGVTPAARERMFAPFAKVHGSGTQGEKSVGLGLAIVRRIVDAHGGAISVDPARERGATFRVEIPRARRA